MRDQWERGTTGLPPEQGGKSLEQYEDLLGFDARELEGKRILDLGSGETEKFSKELKKMGINATVVSLNPDYSFDDSLRRGVQKEDWQKKSVAGIAQKLPFKDESFDLIVGMESVTRYVSPKKDIEVAKAWGSEIVRVLKWEGEARLWPVLELDKRRHDDDGEERIKEFIEYLQSLEVEVRLESGHYRDHPYISGHRIVIKKVIGF